ncbi:hypothetical protein CRM22_002676 [Opisthorchis felineus]|uniref:DH domain-containing protein n=1 Tax=Opisthorchis felineus TaxID=147828 RepID=A0A4S2M502_OPIFE|nr:hypothetical protein CRM22_002676 [Opisthorchis felineus]
MATPEKSSERIRSLYGGPPTRIIINRSKGTYQVTGVNQKMPNDSSKSSRKSTHDHQKAASEPGVPYKPPRVPNHRLTEGHVNAHNKHQHPQPDKTGVTDTYFDRRDLDSLHMRKQFDSRRRRISDSHTLMSSENTMAAKSTTYNRKLRSMSPTKKLSQLFPSKSVTSVSELLTVKLPDGRVLILDELGEQSIGEALVGYMRTMEKPMECVDVSIDRVVPWKTAIRDLNGRALYIREIGGLNSVVISQNPQSGRRLEKRASARVDNMISLHNWFSYFASTVPDEVTLADKYEMNCLLENPPSSTPPSRRPSKFGRRDKEVRSVSGAETEAIFHASTPDSPRLSSSNPRLDEPLTATRVSEYRNRLFSIKQNWEDIVRPNRELTKKEMKKQAAIWEVLVTELNYINDLRCILDNYIAPFLRHREKLFLNLEPVQIFSNLEQVYQANLRLWFGYLHKAYRKVSESGELLSAEILEPGFLQIPQLFWPYPKYCSDLPRCQKYVKHARINNATFATFLQWADKSCPEQREPLWDQLAKPFKRITKYPLMLENIQQYCDDPEEMECLSRVSSQVKAFVRTIDSQLEPSEPRAQMDALVDELMFPDYNENPGDGYQYFYDHFRRSSLLEDIELPAPVVLTVSDIRAIQDVHVLEEVELGLAGHQSRPSLDYGDLTSPFSMGENFFAFNPVSVTTPLRSSTFNLSDFAGASKDHVRRISSLKSISSIDVEPEAIPVYLSRWIPPKGYNTIKLAPTILDRIRSANVPSGLRRTVPRRLLFRGPLRFREGQGKWSDVTCFLLTDQLLITKTYKRESGDLKLRYKVCRVPIRLDKLAVNKLKDNDGFACAALDDFHMIIHLYTFLPFNQNGEEWCSQLRKAQANYIQLMRPEILVATTRPFSDLTCSQDSSLAGHTDPGGKPRSSRQTLLSLARVNSEDVTSSSTVFVDNGKPFRPGSSASVTDQKLIVTDMRFRPTPADRQHRNLSSTPQRATVVRRRLPSHDASGSNSNKYELNQMEESKFDMGKQDRVVTDPHWFRNREAQSQVQGISNQGLHYFRSRNTTSMSQDETRASFSTFPRRSSVMDVFSYFQQPTKSGSTIQLIESEPNQNGVCAFNSESFPNDATPKQFRNSICRPRMTTTESCHAVAPEASSVVNRANNRSTANHEKRSDMCYINARTDKHISTRL